MPGSAGTPLVGASLLLCLLLLLPVRERYRRDDAEAILAVDAEREADARAGAEGSEPLLPSGGDSCLGA